MATKSRRVDIQDLGEPACRLIREVRDSGDEIMLVDGTGGVLVMKPAERITASEALPDWDDWDETDREAWKRLLAIRAELRNWTASMSGAEAVDEQRR